MADFNLYGPINDLGYGVFTRGLISGLLDLNKKDFNLSIIGQPQIEDQAELTTLTRLAQQNPWNRKTTSIAIWHEFDLTRFSGQKLVAFPIFETSDFFPIAKHYMSQMDAVFVASSWAKGVVQKAIGASFPVFVVPAGANLLTSATVEQTNKFNSFTFLTLGKYEQRKSPLETIKAYLLGFQDRPVHTRLICHCYNPFDNNFKNNMLQMLTAMGLKPLKSASPNSLVATHKSCIVEIPLGRIPREQVFQLYKACHMGVFPSKGEGWNLPLMEAIQSGLPCIATDYSAHTEYLTPEFNYDQSLLLKKFALQPAHDGVYFKGDRGNWAVVDVRDLAEKMTYAYDNYSSISTSFDNTKIKETFTWKNMASKFLEATSQI